MKTKKEITNCLVSDLDNLISEFELNRLTTSDILNYFSVMMLDAEVNSQIIVNVLENERFGKEGKEEALNIKINEGW